MKKVKVCECRQVCGCMYVCVISEGRVLMVPRGGCYSTSGRREGQDVGSQHGTPEGTRPHHPASPRQQPEAME